MPQTAEKTNRNNVSQSINSDYCPPENLKMIDGRIHVSARWLAARFGVEPDLMYRVILEIEEAESLPAIYEDDAEIEPIVYHGGKDLWVGDAAFVGVCQHPKVERHFDEGARMAVLQLLGHYCDMSGAA